MLSIDTNILLYAQNRDCPEHDAAAAFLVECAGRADVAVCELVLWSCINCCGILRW
ncbi:Conserved protein of uncharacterised function%2C win PIN domain [Mycobacterium tuberculosis]|nr:Conserved protein of uncharacterised function%2C win PIN domain [Mycobacterium tuberculosis]